MWRSNKVRTTLLRWSNVKKKLGKCFVMSSVNIFPWKILEISVFYTKKSACINATTKFSCKSYERFLTKKISSQFFRQGWFSAIQHHLAKTNRKSGFRIDITKSCSRFWIASQKFFKIEAGNQLSWTNEKSEKKPKKILRNERQERVKHFRHGTKWVKCKRSSKFGNQ